MECVTVPNESGDDGALVLGRIGQERGDEVSLRGQATTNEASVWLDQRDGPACLPVLGVNPYLLPRHPVPFSHKQTKAATLRGSSRTHTKQISSTLGGRERAAMI